MVGSITPAQVSYRASALQVGRPLDPVGQFQEEVEGSFQVPGPAMPSE